MFTDTMAYLVEWRDDSSREGDIEDYEDACAYLWTLEEIHNLPVACIANGD
jgi:hypothetical protein